VRSSALLCAVLLPVLTGCAGVAINVDGHAPALLGVSPEATGETWHGSFSGGIASTHRVRLARAEQDDLWIFEGAGPLVVNTEPRIRGSSGGWIRGDLGVLSFVDLSVDRSADAPLLFGAKVQAIGAPESVRDPGLKVAFAVRHGRGTDRDDNKQQIENAHDGNEYERVRARTHGTLTQGGLILGYRTSPEFLLYQGSALALATSKGELTTESETIPLSGETETLSLSVGVKRHFSASRSGFVQLEVGHGWAWMQEGPTHQGPALRFGVGASW